MMKLLTVAVVLLALLTVNRPLIGAEDAAAKAKVIADRTVVSGDWKESGGSLVVDSLQSESLMTFGDPAWQDYEVEADVTFLKVRDDSRWVSIVVRATRSGQTPWSQIPVRFNATKKNGMEFAVKTASGKWSVRATGAANSPCRLNQSRRLKVIVSGTRVVGFLDNEKVISSHYCLDRQSGCVGLAVSGCIAKFDNVTVRPIARKENLVPQHSNEYDNVAHRGFSSIAPENTLAAIKAAIDAGADGCEFDVYRCKDGTVVLMHDKTVDRTTNGSGRVTEMSLSGLQQLDAGSWKDKKYASETVPTLRQALMLLRGTGCQPVIEIKMEGIEDQVIKDVRDLEMVDDVAVIAFSKTVVARIRQLEPRLTCAWLCGDNLDGTAGQQADWLASQANECGAKLLDLSYKMLSPELIAELKSRGFGVWTWTVNEVPVMRALADWGIDSITTDRPDLSVR